MTTGAPKFERGPLLSEIQNSSIFALDDISDEEMSNLIDGTVTDFDEGGLVTGTVVKIERDEVLLDIGYKSEGVIPSRELSIRKDVNPADVVSMGEEIEALVLQKEDKEGRLVLSKKRAEYERAWNAVEEKFNSGETVEGEVIEVVKGGLILDIGLRGFLPASLVDLRRVKDLKRLPRHSHRGPRHRDGPQPQQRRSLSSRCSRGGPQGRAPGDSLQAPGWHASQGHRLLDRRLRRLRRPRRHRRPRAHLRALLEPLDGLVHISELSWNHVNHPSEVVKVGQEVEVQVLDVDLNRERISLGLKQTTEDPWRSLVKKYPVDAIVEGTVTKLVTFGAFVDLGEGVEGLVHISEMAKQHVDQPSQVCTVGDTVQVKVMEIDLDRRRISLSMKAAAETLGTEVEVKPLPESDKPAEEPEAEVEAEVVETEVEATEE